MIKHYSVSLVMPCRDEEQALKEVLKKLPKEIDEVIVVNNNSSDATESIAQKFGAKILYENRTDKYGIGYGFALQKGIRKATGSIIACMDGDDSYPIKKIPYFVNILLKNKLDFISCNRLPFKKPRKMSAVRTFGVKILNITLWLLFGTRISDSLSGMWVFRKNVLDYISLNEGGWNFSLEIKIKTITNPSLRFAEYAIKYKDRVLNISKQNLLQTGIEHVLYLFRLRRTFRSTAQKLSLSE